MTIILQTFPHVGGKSYLDIKNFMFYFVKHKNSIFTMMTTIYTKRSFMDIVVKFDQNANISPSLSRENFQSDFGDMKLTKELRSKCCS